MIREGRISDSGRMAEIYNHYVKTSSVIFSDLTLTGNEMARKLEDFGVGDTFPFYVVEVEGKVMGYCYAHLWQPDPVYSRTWEITIYLSPDSCGHGYGTRMLGRIVEECRKRGAHTLISDITEGNTACERIHQKTGFTLVGRIPETGYKFGRYYNDIFYQIIL